MFSETDTRKQGLWNTETASYSATKPILKQIPYSYKAFAYCKSKGQANEGRCINITPL